MRTVLVDRSSRLVLVINPPRDSHGNPILPEGMNVDVIDVSDTEAAKFNQSGFVYTLAPDGTIATTAAPPPSPVEIEMRDALADVRAQFAQADLRLNDISANGATYTAPQVRDAMVDMARIIRRTLRLSHAELY
jgi:hypothetical protein